MRKFQYNRAATIKAETVGQLWAMDRQTFRRILLKSAFRKRKMYESLLDTVPMLKTLQVYCHSYGDLSEWNSSDEFFFFILKFPVIRETKSC